MKKLLVMLLLVTIGFSFVACNKEDQKKVDQAKDKAEEKVEEVKDKAEEKVSEVEKKAEEKVSEAESKAEEVVEDVKDAVEGKDNAEETTKESK